MGILTHISLSIRKTFYKDSVFEVFKTDDIKYLTKRVSYKEFSLLQKIHYICKITLRTIFKNLVIIFVCRGICRIFINVPKPEKSFLDFGFLMCAILEPIIEEVLFRLICQNLVGGIQKIFQKKHSSHLSVTSPKTFLIATRILITGSIFALVHLSNGEYISKAHLPILFMSIFLYPIESILYEKTNTILSPILSHIINNTLTYFLQ